MNRIFPRQTIPQDALQQTKNVRLRPTQRLRDDAEAMLREIAYVLQLTRRVKAEIRQEREFVEAAMA